MWLINTHTLKLQFVTNPEDYHYAILSHTWGDEEVLFEDMKNPAIAETKKGYLKIRMTCERARRQGLDFAWVDTCCIDKSSSAELSESINSMFRWYQLSSVCYAWLEDWNGLDHSEMKDCRWFARGWTLQELIAPSSVEFLDRGWRYRGNKRSLSHSIASITYIDTDVLKGNRQLSEVPIGRRMSWAAHRRTTRVEDRSYSLLGMFDINMPLLYGEGEKAFLRLQEEIAKNTSDLSLFAWEMRLKGDMAYIPGSRNQEYFGVFAPSLGNFRYCESLVAQKNQFHNLNEFVVSNKGLKIYTSTIRCKTEGREEIDGMPLWCHKEENPSKVLAVPLTKTAFGYARSHYGKLVCFLNPFSAFSTTLHGVLRSEYLFQLQPADCKQILISKVLDREPSDKISTDNFRFLQITIPWAAIPGLCVTGFPSALWDSDRLGFHLAGCIEFIGLVLVHIKAATFIGELQIVCGYSKDVGGCWATFVPFPTKLTGREWSEKTCAHVLSHFRESNGIRFITRFFPSFTKDTAFFDDWVSVTLAPFDDSRTNN